MRDPLNADLVTNNIYSAYYHYLTSLLQGDLGITYNGGESLKDLIFTVLPPTLELCFTALLLACILGIPLGVLSAVYNQRPCARALQSISNVGLSIPIFWFAPIYSMSQRFKAGRLQPSGSIICCMKSNLSQAFLPLICGLLMSLTEPKSYKTFYSI